MLEVYFDECFDLLQDKVQVPISGFGKGAKKGVTGTFRAMEVQRDANGKWVAPWTDGEDPNKAKFEPKGQSERELNSREELMQIMKIIEATRTAKSHALNDRSSRSHCLVSIKQTKKSGKSAVSSKFTFVDLAGSERIAKSLATEVKAAEAKNINTSLSALGRTIKELSKSKQGFIPWRDSALTMLMKDSLSGNCITQLIVCVAEAAEMSQETTSTLRFGLTCGQIKGEVQQEKSYDVDKRSSHLK